MAAYQDSRFDAHTSDIAQRSGKPTRQWTRMMLYLQLLIVDCLMIALGVLLPSLALHTFWRPYSGVNVALLLLPLFVMFAINDSAYSIAVLSRPLEGAGRATKALILAIFAVLLVAFFVRSDDMISRLTFGVSALASNLMIAIGRLIFDRHVRRVTDGRLLNELMIVDGVTPAITTRAVVIDAVRLKLVPDATNPRMLHRFGVLTKGFDRVVIATEPSRRSAWALLMKGADIYGELLIEQFNEIGAIAIDAFEGVDTVLVSRRALGVPERAKKRALDLVIAIPLLIALMPLMLIVAIAVQLDSRGPALFKQERVGRGNRIFNVLKFRSMKVEETDAAGNRSASRVDDRITRVGKIIRKTSIDELPQLINVVLGDMSLAGPRPHALGSLAGEHLFWEVDETYCHRHRLKPGITGLAQIRGYRGATLERDDLINRLQADLEYIDGWTIWRDFGILFNTVRVLVHQNAY